MLVFSKKTIVFIKIYEYNVPGKISDERFCRMSANYEKEHLETIRECTDLKELTPTIVNTLIKRIEVHNSDKGKDGLKQRKTVQPSRATPHLT